MLILSRRVGEAIVVGDAVITINRVAGNRVTVGIKAPPEIAIRRGELDPVVNTLAHPAVSAGSDELSKLRQPALG